METGKEVVKISLTNIIPNRFQPRISFDEEALNELANSIKMYGILQPLILRPLGDKYEIIAGERRYKAATIAGLTDVPAILVNFDDQTSAELAIIENIQRKDLTAIEEAKSYKKLLDLGNYTQEQLASKMGKSQSSIANKLRLLNLIPEAQDALMNNLISERHARSLLQLKDNPEKQREILNKITTERMTVKETDEQIKAIMGGNDMNQNTEIPTYQPDNNINIEQPVIQQTINEPLNISPAINNTPIVNTIQNEQSQEIPVSNSNVDIPNIQPIVAPTPSFDIPNYNNDTFNLAELSNPNLNVPTTPQNNEKPTFDINSLLNSTTTTEPLTVTPESDFSTPNFDSLLQTEKKMENNETMASIPTPKFAPATAPTNKYFPDLEKETVNMSFANPYSTPAPSQETSPNNTIDINSAINETRETIKNLETKGYKITTEESDLQDTYQIIINIKKDTIPTA